MPTSGTDDQLNSNGTSDHNLFLNMRRTNNFCIYVCGLVILSVSCCDVRNIKCPELPQRALKAILGTTYNPRYMRIELSDAAINSGVSGGKRASAEDHADFFMEDSTDDNPYAGIPAWEVDHTKVFSERRKRRAAQEAPKKRDARQVFIEQLSVAANKDNFQSRPWDCQPEVHWIDLGRNYFPRYLRSIKCMKKNCWYGHYTCKGKKFSVKVLKRSTGRCAKINQRLRLFSLNEATGEYAQQWEFEERAVTFCCDCVMI